MYNRALSLNEKQKKFAMKKNPENMTQRKFDYNPTETLLAVTDPANRRIIRTCIAIAWELEKKLSIFEPFFKIHSLDTTDDSIAKTTLVNSFGAACPLDIAT